MKQTIAVLLFCLLTPLVACGQQTAEQQLGIDIAPALLVVMTTTLPGGQMGVPYSATLAAMGGTPPYTWAVLVGPTYGLLPAGLTLGPTDGVLSGTATETGSFVFTVEATDSAGTAATRTFELGGKPAKDSKKKIG